jgi:type II secretory pathway pseudopilin PulG
MRTAIKQPVHSGLAFSLVELLVCITVVAVLTSLGIMYLPTILEKARATKCMANLRGIGMALNSYLNDNDQRMPTVSDGNFEPVLEPYAGGKSIFLCPSDPSRTRRQNSSYRWNPGLDGQLATNLKWPFGNTVITDKRDIMVLCDKEPWHHYQPELKEFNRDGRFIFLWADGSANNHPITLPTPPQENR